MTTISDTFRSPAGTGVAAVVVRATLVAASEVLSGGGAIIRETETTTASDGTWSLTLTPIDDLAVSDGAYYLVTADGHRWTIDVPASGTHALDAVQVEPGPLPSTGATTAQVVLRPVIRLYNADTAEYDSLIGAVIYVGGPTDPTVNDGDVWIDTGSSPGDSGPIADGVRAAPGTVGFLGDEGDLFVLNANDSLVGTVFDGTATAWDTGNLIVRGDDIVVDGYLINAPVIHEGGTNLTISGSVIHAAAGVGFYGISANGTGRGLLTVQDTTIVCDPGPGTASYAAGIISDARVIARRCDVSGSGDGIHGAGQPGSTFADGSIVSQCYIHGLSFLDSEQHLDGIQFYNATADNTATDTFGLVEGCYVVSAIGPLGEPMNSAITTGKPGGDDTGPYLAIEMDNNYFEAGLYHLRHGLRMHNSVITNNNLGAVTGEEFGLVSVDLAGSVASWTNNRTGSGLAGTGTVVNNPNP